MHVLISGRVQGVWYRGWAVGEANGLGLSGWIRNRRDGTVEAVVAGPAGHVDALVERFWQGPPAARVTAVAVAELDGDTADVGAGFQQRPGA